MTDRHGHPSRIALALADILAATTATSVAYVLRFQTGLMDVPGRVDVLPANYLRALPIVAVAGLAATALAGLQDRRRAFRPPTVADAIRAAAFLGAALAVLALLWWKEFQYSRAVIALTALLAAPLLLVTRQLALSVVRAARRGRFRVPVLFIGSGETATRLAAELQTSDWLAVDVVGVVIPAGEVSPWNNAARLPSVAAAVEMLGKMNAREVFIALPAARSHELAPTLEALAQTTADVRVVPDMGNAVLVNPGLIFVGTLPVLTARETPLYGARAAVKRTTDIVVALLAMLLAAPLLILIAAAVKATSRGPMLYGQDRMGLDGATFRMWKFRTMQTDAEARTGPAFATPDDPRVTGVGRFLRRFSLDELPQLWNVLRGEMSLVGPRPERGPFIEELRRRFPGYMLRHAVKAGMTGWAQVHGLRGESSRELRLRYDLEYIERWSLSLDAEILGRTAFQVLLGHNAY